MSGIGSTWELLGARGDLLNAEQLTNRLIEPLEGSARIVANHNLHSIFLLRRNAWMSTFFESAEVTHIDGMPLVWLCRLGGAPARREHRVTYVDWLPMVLEAANRLRWRVFYLGSTPEVCETGVRAIRLAFPNITISGRDGYFDAAKGAAENETVVSAIQSFAPDLLLVGMGMPRQERWILENLGRLGATRVLPCGAAVDFYSGAVRSPPRWLGQLGLEWAFRLINEPRRLAGRYLIEPLWLVGPLVVDVVRRRFGGSRPRGR